MDSLGDRMKKYEEAARNTLPGRLPVLVRLDGKAFHTYTKGLAKPLDLNLVNVMNSTAIEVCKAIQGAQIAYVQSDEISILIHNYKTLESTAWFDNQVQKIVSISAGVASGIFTSLSPSLWENKETKVATFDARAFVLPESDVCNYFVWRQKDWIRNSVQMLARSLYSHKSLDRKKNEELKKMCAQKGKKWDDESNTFRRGRCILRETYISPGAGASVDAKRTRWTVDNDIPLFTENRDYINNHLKTHSVEESDD